MTYELVFVSGLISGLAASLHCAGLCGGIAAMLLPARLVAIGHSATYRLSFLARMQAGRATVYVAAGAAAGSLGQALGGLLAIAGLQDVLRHVSAAVIILTGLSIAGILPALRLMDRHASLLARLQGLQARSAFGIGAVLAMAPCAMAINALMTAALLGSPMTGGIFMAAFSLAALPGVVLSALGISSLASLGHDARQLLRRVSGAALVIVGLVMAFLPGATISQLCFG